MLTGLVLVIGTWLLGLTSLVLLGAFPAYLVFRNRSRLANARGHWLFSWIRLSMWWGLALLTLLVLTCSLFGGLQSPPIGWWIAFLAAVSTVSVVLSQRLTGRGTSPLIIARMFTRSDWLLALAGILVLVVLAAAALGPVTHYDAGLYQLGGILYARDYGAIPGLANLFNPFGYTTAQAPLAALLSSTPWDDNGFRLINGLFATVFLMDVALRAWQRLWTWGTYVMILGAGLTLSLLIPMGDFWLASPSVDTAIFFVGIAGTAYLADALTAKDPAVPGTTVLLIGLLLIAQRPTVIPFALTLMVIVAVLLVRNSASVGRSTWVLLSALTLGLALVQGARDYVLSGWLLYPLSLFAFDVDWRASDPTALRTATLGAARDPSNLWESAANWEWVPGWLARSASTWEAPVLLALLILALGSLVWIRKKLTNQHRIMLLVALTPSVLASATWFIASPPSFRFAWPFLFSIPLLILALSLSLTEPRKIEISRVVTSLPQMSIVLVSLAVGFSSIFTLTARSHWDQRTEQATFGAGPTSMVYRTAPITDPVVQAKELRTGLTVVITQDTEQCWQRYPLCVPRIEESVRSRGPSIRDGFSR